MKKISKRVRVHTCRTCEKVTFPRGSCVNCGTRQRKPNVKRITVKYHFFSRAEAARYGCAW